MNGLKARRNISKEDKNNRNHSPIYLCENCHCIRYAPCSCVKKEEKEA